MSTPVLRRLMQFDSDLVAEALKDPLANHDPLADPPGLGHHHHRGCDLRETDQGEQHSQGQEHDQGDERGQCQTNEAKVKNTTKVNNKAEMKAPAVAKTQIANKGTN